MHLLRPRRPNLYRYRMCTEPRRGVPATPATLTARVVASQTKDRIRAEKLVLSEAEMRKWIGNRYGKEFEVVSDREKLSDQAFHKMEQNVGYIVRGNICETFLTAGRIVSITDHRLTKNHAENAKKRGSRAAPRPSAP